MRWCVRSKYFKIKEYSYDSEALEIITENDHLFFTIGITDFGNDIDQKLNIYIHVCNMYNRAISQLNGLQLL